jgi:Stage II sporulation protein E (SpoIIE)
MRLRFALISFFIAWSGSSLTAQPPASESDVVTLQSWRVMEGDILEWARPEFDDSDWRDLGGPLEGPCPRIGGEPAMDQRMLAHSSGGFTTCLVLRADAGGALIAANAGHIAPYLAGEELALENGLPLGLFAQVTYPESTFQLEHGEQLTLLADGVVEAREKTGELFGFDRTAAIGTQSAEAIAVLTVMLAPGEKECAA